jgi:hypothetical protein
MVTPASSDSALGAPAPWLKIDDQLLHWATGLEVAPCAEVQEEWAGAGYREFVLEPLPDAPVRLDVWVDDGQTEHALQPLNGRWYWQPEGSAGRYALRVKDARSGEERRAWVRVLPSNIGAAHYAAMLADIQRVAHQLIFHAAGGAREAVRFSDDDASASIGLIEFHKFGQLMTPLGQVINSLRRDPREVLTRRVVRTPMALAAGGGADHSSVRRDRDDIAVTMMQPSLDVYEHRLLRRLVCERLPAKARLLRRQLEQEIAHHAGERDHAIKRAAKSKDDDSQRGWERTARRHASQVTALADRLSALAHWEQQLRVWRRLPCVAAAGALRQRAHPTPALMSEPRYSRFYKLYLAFNRDVRLIDLNTVHALLNVRHQWALYETWVALTLAERFRRRLLDAGFEQTGAQGLFRLTDDTFVAELDRGCMLTFARGERRVRIAYERVYEPPTVALRNGDRLTTTTNGQLKPDLVVELYERDAIKNMLIIDAKYKHAAGRALDKDVGTVRAYLDQIALTEADTKRRLPIRTACDRASGIIAFPGAHVYPEVELAGALPLVPGEADGQWAAYEEALGALLT